MAIFKISTTGTVSPVILTDLGARSFTHPIVEYVLTDEYTMEQIRESESLRAAIDGGELTADLDGLAITTGALFDAIVEDFLNKRVSDVETLANNNAAAIAILEKGGRRLKKVLDYVDNTAVPPTEVTGDRYILDDTGASNAAWDGAAALSLVEFNGTTWDVIATLEGDVVYVDAENSDRVLVDDGAPFWELRDGLLEQNAFEVPYTPTTPADWTDPDPVNVGEALDDLAGIVGGFTSKKSFTFSAGEDGTLGGDRDLVRTGSMGTNVSPFIVPIASNIWGISIASDQGTNVSFQVQIIKNGIVAHTETVTTSDKAFNAALAVACVAGDELRIRFIRTGQNIKNLGVEIFLQES